MSTLSFEPVSHPVPVILDTDMATDCDDAGSMAVLHALSAAGEADILAVVVNNKGDASVGAVAAINAFYGKADIPLGAYQGDEVGTEPAAFVQELAADTQTYGHTVKSRKQVPSAVEVYRQALANSSDGEVVIISIGHLNNLADLLVTELALVKRKVAHLVVMGGDYPAGKEHNFAARGSGPSAVYVMKNWPTPILFSGFTLGARIKTGPGLADLPPSHPVRRAYAGHSSNPLQKGRSSWDQTAVLAAVRGPACLWNLSTPGYNRVENDGTNQWQDDPNGIHAYLIERDAPEIVAAEIERLMVKL